MSDYDDAWVAYWAERDRGKCHQHALLAIDDKRLRAMIHSGMIGADARVKVPEDPYKEDEE